jgi:hypothetical protein
MRSSPLLASTAALFLSAAPLINASPQPIGKRQAVPTASSPSTNPPDTTNAENSVILTIQLDPSLSSATTLTVPLDSPVLSNFMQRATFGTSLNTPGVFCGAFQDTGASVLVGSIFDSAQPGQFNANGRPSLAEAYCCSRNKMAVERRVKETVVVGGEGSYAWKMEQQGQVGDAGGVKKVEWPPAVGGGGGGDTAARPFPAPAVAGAGGGDKGWDQGKGQDPKHGYTHMAEAPQPTVYYGGGDKSPPNNGDKPWEQGKGQDPKHGYTHMQGSAPAPTVAWDKQPQSGQYGGGDKGYDSGGGRYDGGNKDYNPNSQYGGGGGGGKPWEQGQGSDPKHGYTHMAGGGAPAQPQQTGDVKPWGSNAANNKNSYNPKPWNYKDEGKGWEQGKGADPAHGYQHMNSGGGPGQYAPKPWNGKEEEKGWEQGKGADPAHGYQHMNGGGASGYHP